MSGAGNTRQTRGPRRRTGRLFTKYVLSFVALIGVVMAVSTGLNMWFDYREQQATAIRLQHEKAQSAASKIEQFIAEIERQIGWTTHAQWAAASVEQRRFDYVRLLRQVPAITELSQLDSAGKEQLRVSRLAMDAIGSQADFSADPRFTEAVARRIWFSPVYFRKESEPYMTMAVARSGRNAGVTVAEINLKLIWDVITQIKAGIAGYAYVVDQKGRLIAHPDISLVLRNTDLSKLPQVTAALGAPRDDALTKSVSVATDPSGRAMLSAFAPISQLGWLVFVELPVAEALAPLWASLWQTVAILAAGLALAIMAALWLARRMVVPIRALQVGAAEIGAGDLGKRIIVRTGDELEMLADQFNDMTGRLQDSYAGLERKVEERTRELRESLEYQTATSDVLKVISRSPSDIQPVLDAVGENAARLCDANNAVIFQLKDDVLRQVASYGGIPTTSHPTEGLPVNRGRVTGRAVFERQTVHVHDLAAADSDFPEGSKDARRDGHRTTLATPLLREGVPLGAILIRRMEVRPFSDRQVKLLETFADQAAIAIENARLINELKESLEQQTATAEVLRVISRSPFALDMVLQNLLDTAATLANTEMAWIGTLADGQIQLRAGRGMAPNVFAEAARLIPGAARGTAAGRALVDGRTCHVPDLLADPEFLLKDLAQRGNWRTVLAVPLMRDGRPLGVIALLRTRVQPFGRREIDLVETFADQAVIAIENARLFGELQERTKELARSVEELKALGEVGRTISGTLDLKTVLDMIVTRAVELGEADGCTIFRYKHSTREFLLWHAAGLDSALVQEVRGMRLGEDKTVMGQAVHGLEPVQIPDLTALPTMPLRNLSVSAGYNAALIMPLVRAGRIFGALVLQRRKKGEFAPSTVNLLRTFASQSSLAIQNARLFREIEEKSRQLEAASQHKSQFLANMSHELRTPLNAILGYTELMLDGLYGALGDKSRGVLERVQANGKHLLGLINDVLDLAKIEAGQLTLSIAEYSIASTVHSVVAATELLARAKGLVLASEVAPGLPVGEGDERRLTQVLLNIVGNAIKFTDTGSVTIGAAATDGYFTLFVRDTGPGIPVHEQDRIFEEFQQVDNSNTRKKGGTGLGLAISKRIIEMHGGTIAVESVPGQGATFRIHLPVHVAGAKEVA